MEHNEVRKYVGVIFKTGKIIAFPYSASRVGAVNLDMLNNPLVDNFLPGFDTEAAALLWAENNRK